jgi:hypothetical protein
VAEALKRQYDIIVLKTELLDEPAQGANVRLTLQSKVAGQLQDHDTWLTSTQALGLSLHLDRRSALGAGPPLQLPNNVIYGLIDFMQRETNRDRPLWVHLVKPYGVLRFVPWEALLGDALGIAVLMLPDFIFPPPRETKSVLDIVLCGSAPLGHEHWSVQDAIRRAVDRILNASARRTRIQVFVDSDIAGTLREEWRAAGRLESTVWLHDTAAASRYVLEDPSSRLLDRTGAIRSPWLLWMRNALRQRSVDVLHFVCHGYLSRERGAMLFAQSPLERTDRFLAGPVGSPELQTFLTQVGAWSTVFTSLADNYSEPGLRALADDIAQNRPGPLLMHTMRHDPEAAALSPAYRFLYSVSPVPAPASNALLIYCQPYRAARTSPAPAVQDSTQPSSLSLFDVSRNVEQRAAAAKADAGSPLDRLFDLDDNASCLVASTERFAEQVHLRYQQFARDGILPSDRSDHDMTIANDTIDALREAVAEVADDNEPNQTVSG